MTLSLLDPATDWIRQTGEERLLLCLETVFVHGYIDDRAYHQATAKLRVRAEKQRELRASMNWNWSWWAVDLEGPDEKPETYQINEPTREAVIATALRDYGHGAWIAIVEATQEGPFKASPFAENGDCKLMEELQCQFIDDNSDRWGEHSDGPTFPGEDMARALNTAFAQVIAANHDTIMEAAWSFTQTRNAEVLQLGIEEGSHG